MKDLKGFTLIKFTLLITIIGVLSIIAVRTYKNYIRETALHNTKIEEPKSETISSESIPKDD